MQEISLIASILHRAIDDILEYKRDYLSGRYNAKRHENESDDKWARRKADTDRSNAEAKSCHNDAVAWLKSTKRDYLFSFESCCFLLDLDPESVRERVLGITIKKLSKNHNRLTLKERITAYSIANPTESITSMAKIFRVRKETIWERLSNAHIGFVPDNQYGRRA